MKIFFKKHTYSIIIFLFAFLLYGNTINNQFSIDDNIVTHLNKDIQEGIRGIPHIFKTHYKTSDKIKYSYRPIVKTTFAIEYSIFGGDLYVSHLINVVLYALLLLILFNTLKLLFKNYGNKILFSFLVVLIFAAHPIHTEAVASLKNRDVLLSFLFGILGLYLILQYSNKNKILFLSLSIISYIIGFLSKPDIMVFAIIYPLSLYIFTKMSNKKVLLILALFILLLIILRYVPRFYLPDSYRPKFFYENPLFFDNSISIRFQAAFNTSLFYLKKTLYPHPLLFYYGYNTVPVYGFTFISILSGVFHISIFAYAIFKIKENKILSFGILFYLISISMFLNFLIPAVGIVAERYAFVAVLGFSILLSYFIFKIYNLNIKNKTTLKQISILKLSVLAVLLIAFSYKTISRNVDWYNEDTLYSSDIKYLKTSAKANEIYATKMLKDIESNKLAYNDISKIKNIEKYYKNTIDIDSSYSVALKRLGFIYTVIYNKPEQGLEYLKLHQKYEKDDPEALSLIALSYEKTSDFTKAISFYYKTLELDSNYIPAISKIANYNFNQGNIDSAVYLNKRIMKISPNLSLPYDNLFKYYYLLKDTNKMNYYINLRSQILKANKAGAIIKLSD